ncbi:hypothetical protein G17_00397 [Escherichia phage vB_EcoM_G17]|uniref:Uncharacterized protein n=4 Tax=Asteriusvirus PBECO4 TaxID=2560463 RepID=A0A1C3S761_9CAUD|nr:hypothetical protein [Escherichia coli]YP_009150361.1 hypothetical protein ACQ29_gp047 [Escherichia phage PBECO4]AXC36843.1 hypothetical protein [Escherichia phage UB]MED6573315.1 hypothetical protein [Escherichia coli O157]QBO61886.1 hypothetical protein G17_00397 [Escherichia phage vB_EcoM_G17]WNN14714.1 hypothetical protein Sharanji_gp433 [Escherichia phage Sharanji]WPK18228.1 hypothetical protein [Salmonella phage SD-2_S15]WPK18879.1 hypothetical protein [Salmonella phage SD-6_S16]WP
MVDSFMKKIFKKLLSGFEKAVSLIFSSVVMVITVLAFSLVLHFVPFWLIFIVLIALLGAHVYYVYRDALDDDND